MRGHRPHRPLACRAHGDSGSSSPPSRLLQGILLLLEWLLVRLRLKRRLLVPRLLVLPVLLLLHEGRPQLWWQLGRWGHLLGVVAVHLNPTRPVLQLVLQVRQQAPCLWLLLQLLRRQRRRLLQLWPMLLHSRRHGHLGRLLTCSSCGRHGLCLLRHAVSPHLSCLWV
jgi:hypothetical protein